MKNRIYIAALTITLLATSCKKELDNAGTNQNNPTNVPVNLMLPAATINVAYASGGDICRFSGLFTQQMANASGARQYDLFNRYIFSTTDFDYPWQNLYVPMYNLKGMRDSAIAQGNSTYAGIGNILLAYSLALVTDEWGDVPYSNALQGVDAVQPKVDRQEDIYKSIQILLDSGIARLGMPVGAIAPAGDDFVYQGDKDKWKALAYSLKARYYLHIRKADASAATKAMAAITNGFTNSTQDAYVAFGSNTSTSTPMYQFNNQRQGEISFLNGILAPAMQVDSDPRLTAFVDTTNDWLGSFYGATNAGVQLMTYAELLFIKAELEMVAGNTTDAATDYNAAVTESVNYFSTSGAAWLTTHASETSSTITLEKIMNQKYVALFLNPENFVDWRRTGYPTLTPNDGKAIPRRLYYPQKEIAGNSNVAALPNSSLTAKMWWDK
jgi:Starch-binding associating with outer membrane